MGAVIAGNTGAHTRPGTSMGLWRAIAVPARCHHIAFGNISFGSFALGLRSRFRSRHLCRNIRHQLGSPDLHRPHSAAFACFDGSPRLRRRTATILLGNGTMELPHLVYFALEGFSYFHIEDIAISMGVSFAASLLLIILAEHVRNPKK